jgi:2-methylaconitate cis-trans-isomerase PrpF
MIIPTAFRSRGFITPNPIPASFLRGGTSKGIFINRAHLPPNPAQWDQIFLGIMGSPDPIYKRQMNGMGGGVSSLSKICVVAPSSATDQKCDVEYTFAQVGIADDIVDYSGNCGNLSCMIGVFAMDEGMCVPQRMTATSATIRALNTNTAKVIDATFPVARVEGSDVVTPVLDLQETSIGGVSGMASKILLDFIDPSGARTGKLLPTGNPIDTISISHTMRVRASLVDATNPTVFVLLPASASQSHGIDHLLQNLELTRQAAARLMKLDPSAQAQPKIAVLSPPSRKDVESGIQIRVQALSMGVVHRAVPMTVGLCLGVAAGIEGTIAWVIVNSVGSRWRTREDTMVRIGHPSGTVDVGAEVSSDGTVTSAKVVRTGRRLMKGHVWW